MNETGQVESLVQKMLENVLTWDQTIENGIVIIQNNQHLMHRYQQLELIPQVELARLEALFQHTKRIQRAIKDEREVVLKELNQTTKTNKMIGGYLLQHTESVFVDKDF